MSDEQPTGIRRSRFRRSSRFRAQKELPSLSGLEESVTEAAAEETEGGFISPIMEAKPPEEQEPPPLPPVQVTNILTVDVKEWFQTPAFRGIIKFSHWGKYERRIEQGINIILAMLRERQVKATFFVLGIVAREFPELIRTIKEQGHEIGTMGYYNRPINTITAREYIKELEMSLSLLTSLTNQEIILHRAPEWSVTMGTLWVMDVLKSYGIKYDSSIYPVYGDTYGIPNSSRFPYRINPHDIIEVPPTTYQFAGKNIPIFGGTYLRILPFGFISMGLSSLNHEGRQVLIHITPWEIEGNFPKIKLDWDGYMSQYAGIKSTFSRVLALLDSYKFDTITNALAEKPVEDAYHITNLGRKIVMPPDIMNIEVPKE